MPVPTEEPEPTSPAPAYRSTSTEPVAEPKARPGRRRKRRICREIVLSETSVKSLSNWSMETVGGATIQSYGALFRVVLHPYLMATRRDRALRRAGEHANVVEDAAERDSKLESGAQLERILVGLYTSRNLTAPLFCEIAHYKLHMRLHVKTNMLSWSLFSS